MEEILIANMYDIGHIVYACNVKTVQQKYMKGKNEKEIASASKKKRRKT